MGNWWDTVGTAWDNTPQQQQPQPQQSNNWWDNAGNAWDQPALPQPQPAANPFSFLPQIGQVLTGAADYARQQQQQQTWDNIFSTAGQALQTGQNYNQQSSYDYNPETPFTQADYQQPQQPQPTPQPVYQPDYNNANNGKPYVPQARDFATRPTMPYEEGYNPETGGAPNPANLFGAPAPQKDFVSDYAGTVDSLAQGALNVAGAIPAAASSVVNAAAQSNIPGVSQLGQYVGFVRDNIVAPAFSIGSSVVGDYSKGRGNPTPTYGLNKFQEIEQKANNGENSSQRLGDYFSSIFDPAKAQQAEAYRQQAMQEDYAQQIAAGATPEVAKAHAQATGLNLLNPANYGEAEGLKAFGQLPAAVQLITMFADPIANKLGGMAVESVLGRAGSTIGKLADKTGAKQLVDTALENTVRAPEQRAYLFGQTADHISTTLDQAATSVGATAADVLPDFLYNMASPLYYEKLMPGIAKDTRAQAAIDYVQKAYEAAPEYTPGRGDAPSPAESKLAQDMQDTGQRPTPAPGVTPAAPAESVATPNVPVPSPASLDAKLQFVVDNLPIREKINRPLSDIRNTLNNDYGGSAERYLNDVIPGVRKTPEIMGKAKQWDKDVPPKTPPIPEQVAAGNTSDAAFNAISQENVEPLGPKAQLPARYEAVKLPYKNTGDAGEFFNAAKQMQGVDVKALRPVEGSKTPQLRPAQMLEDWGKLGAAIRGVNKYTTVPLSRVYLETASRAVRDPASNLIKYGVTDPSGVASFVLQKFGVGGYKAITDRFKSIFGDVESLGPASMTADLGGKRSTNGLANLAYHVANPFNEISADVLRTATGGKFKSYSEFIEKNENSIKEFMYKKEALAAYDRSVGQGALTKFFQENPDLWKAVQLKNATVEQLQDVIRGRTFNGFDMNDLANNKYNPAMPSKEWNDLAKGVAEGTSGNYGQIIKDAIDSLQTRLKAYNDKQLEAARKVSGYYRAKTPKMKAIADRNAQANAKLIRWEDLDSNSPIVQQMVNDTLDAFDANRITLFPQDNKVYDLANLIVNQAAKYAADSRRYDMFLAAFEQRRLMNEAQYATRFKGPQTDFDRMMALKDRYESGAKMTLAQIKEYEAMRDSISLPQQAANAGVELPDTSTVFDGVKTLEDFQKALKQNEGYKSSPIDEFGGESLTVADQKRLAQILFDKDRTGFNQFVSDIRANPRYIEGVTGKGVYTDKNRANADRTVNRLEQYWNDALNKDRLANQLPAPTNAPNIRAYSDAIGNPVPRRMKVGTINGGRVAYGNVLTQDAMRKIAGKFNRTDTFTPEGKVYNKGTTPEQMNQYLRDFQATDQYYRQVTNNTFRLDPQIAAPVRISDGVSLQELMGGERPPKIGPEIKSLEDTVKASGVDFNLDGATTEQLGDLMKTAYGEKAMQDFSTMPSAERDIIFQDVSRTLLGVDPLNPLTNPKGNLEHSMAVTLLQRYLDDMDSRKADYAARVAKGEDLTQQFNLDMKQVTDSLLAERFAATYAARKEAYNSVKGTFFDYRNKNRIDQVLGTVLPFQYWARQNFAYLARYFAKNPYQFAATLNFYQQLEKQNNDPTIPGYAKYNLHVAELPGGQHLMWDFGSLNPFNPLGNNQSFGGLTTMDDQDLADSNTPNAGSPLGVFDPKNIGAFFLGSDKKNAQGKVTGRDKGLLSNWIRPNPAIQDFLQTGIFNKWLGNAGLLSGDQTTFGQDYPEDTRGQHSRAGLLPAATQYRDLGAMTGLTKTLRGAGLPIQDLDIEGPVNNLLYGKNAGKQQTAIYQEINRMVANGEIKPEEGKLAVAAYKDGSYNSMPLLAALDRVSGDNAMQRLASMVGFSAQLYNTPRQQITQGLYDAQSKAYAADGKTLPGYKLDANGNAISQPGAVSQFYKDNPAASVLSTEQNNDTPETIRQSVADDKTYAALDKLKAQRKDGSLDYPTYTAELNKLQGENPKFFDNNPYYKISPGEAKQQELTDQYKAIGGSNFDDLQTQAFALKNKGDEEGYKKIVSSEAYTKAQKARDDFILSNPDWYKEYSVNSNDSQRARNAELVGGLGRTSSAMAPKTSRSLADISYSQQLNDYYAKGGDIYDKQQAQIQDYFDKGQDAKAYAIINSRDYQRVQSTLQQYKLDTPAFATRYDAEYKAKYGKNPRSDDELLYDQQRATFYNIGGARYDQLATQISDLFDKNDSAGAYKIQNSREYKAMQAARDQYLLDNPDFATRYNQDYIEKNGKAPKTDAEKEYSDLLGQYSDIGGAKYDALSELANQYYDSGNKAAYNAIAKSADYTQAKAARKQFLADHPDFAKQYQAELDAKYGPTNSTSSNSSANNGKSSGSSAYSNYSGTSSGSKEKSYTASSAKNYNTQNRYTANTKNTTQKKTVSSGYVNPFSLPITDNRNPFFIPGKAAGPATTSRTSYNGTTYTKTPTSTTTRGNTPSTTSSGSSTWDTAQKRAYAQQLAKGKSKAYAAAVANNYYKKKSY